MSEIKEYGKKILDTFRKNIIDYFQSFKGGVNVLYSEFLDSVTIQPAQSKVYTIGIPIEKGKKLDFFLTEVESSFPTLAIITLKNFPIDQIMVRLDFPSVIYGAKGQFPKIIFTAQLKTPWPGEFGLAWLPSTGSEAFAFHPYENREKKYEEIVNFYHEGIVDTLCDFLNTSDYKLAQKLRNNIKELLESKEKIIFRYPNPFQKKKVFNTINVPIYCEFFDENDASILYFECYIIKGVKGLPETWIPPADIIVNILQYIAMSTELFDYDGNLLPEEDLQKSEEKLEEIEGKVQKYEKEKKAAVLKEEWDPFKGKKGVRRDALGYSMSDGTVIKEEHQSVLDKVAKMKALMQQKHDIEEETPVPPPLVAEEPPEPQEEAPPKTPITTPLPPRPEPVTEKSIIKEPQPRLRGGSPTPAPEPTPQKEVIQKTDLRLRKGRAESAPAEKPPELDTLSLWQKGTSLPTKATQVSKPSTPTSKPSITPSPAKPAAPKPKEPKALYASSKDWFNQFQMNQFVMIGSGSDLPFRKRGDFKILQTLPKPFMLLFAKNQLGVKKGLTSSEVIDILFELYKTGHLKPL
jgi:hypothetical protein